MEGDILSIISDPLLLSLLLLNPGDNERIVTSAAMFPIILEFGT